MAQGHFLKFAAADGEWLWNQTKKCAICRTQILPTLESFFADLTFAKSARSFLFNFRPRSCAHRFIIATIFALMARAASEPEKDQASSGRFENPYGRFGATV
jgi:hypothetical protein